MKKNQKNTLVVEAAATTSNDAVNASTATIAKVEKSSITTLDNILEKVTAGWSPSETRQANEAAQFAVSQVAKAAESLMQVGEKFLTLQKQIGTEKFRAVVHALDLARIQGLSESNIGLWMGRARILSEKVPNVLVRRQLLTLSGGQGLVVRFEPTDDEKKNGSKGHYDLSPYFKGALEAITIPDTKSPSEAELVARQLVEQANKARSAARVPKSPSTIRAEFEKSLVADFVAYLDKYGIKAAMDMTGRFDKIINAKVDASGMTLEELEAIDVADGKTTTAKPKTAAKTA